MDPSNKIPGNCVNAPQAPPPPRRLLDQLSDRIRFKHYSIRTEQAYSDGATLHPLSQQAASS
jgi:hypothetical protein